MPWSQPPRCLLPDFIWPQRPAIPLALEIPPTPRLPHPYIRRFCGVIHKCLKTFSIHYCQWTGIRFDNCIIQLPFGLILKWSDGLRLDEVLAMQVARAAGFPVPKYLCVGDHPDTPHAPTSILMTRIPGECLGEVYKTMTDEERESVFAELKTYMDVMRNWTSPWGPDQICSISGGAIRSVRVPGHSVGPCKNEQDFNEFLISAAFFYPEGQGSRERYEALLARAKKMHTLSHPVVFSHGDLKHFNLMVDKGKITGFIDWESAGWYPDYWDFTTALRFASEDYWWYQFGTRLGGSRYLAELDCERALTLLTSASYYW